jgi:hypothetical protein
MTLMLRPLTCARDGALLELASKPISERSIHGRAVQDEFDIWKEISQETGSRSVP